MKPEFITFTGADDSTSIEGMHDLARRYPIEWGILFSPSRQGKEPRYPCGNAQSRFLHSGLRLAAHLCGDYSRKIMAGEDIVGTIPVDLGYFNRIQINHADPIPLRIQDFGNSWGPRCIAQTRSDYFPPWGSIDWLFDRSGGRGKAPTAWPPHPRDNRTVGYAGGISPETIRGVISVLENIGGRYWIDMETGVRTDDRFNLEKCRQVCEAVYGVNS